MGSLILSKQHNSYYIKPGNILAFGNPRVLISLLAYFIFSRYTDMHSRVGSLIFSPETVADGYTQDLTVP